MSRIRRMPVRFRDADCPADVADIFDHPEFGDRYTIFYRPIQGEGFRAFVLFVGCSEAPFHPQGIGMHGEMHPVELGRYRERFRRQRIAWSQLPEDVKRLARQDCRD